MKLTVLVVANRTAASPDLVSALIERARDTAVQFELLVPPSAAGPQARAAARRVLDDALARYAEAGLEARGLVGSDSDPVVAAIEVYDPGRHDEIIVSTLPPSASHWMRVDGPARIGKATGALVRHVVSRQAPLPRRSTPRRTKPPSGVLAPFVALGYGGRHDEARPE